jgi:hypothetical protein
MENHVYVVQSTATNIEKTNWGGRMDTQTHATPSLSQKPRQSLNIVPSDFGARNNSRKTKSSFFELVSYCVVQDGLELVILLLLLS